MPFSTNNKIQLVDGSGDPVILGTTTYSETSTEGVVIGAVRNDTLAALAGTENEIAPLQVNADGALYVDTADGAILESAVDGLEGLAALQVTTNTNTGTIATNTADIVTNTGTIATNTADIVTNTSGFASSIALLGGNFVDQYGGSRNTSICGVLRNDVLENAIGGVVDGDFTVPQVNAIGGLYVTGSEIENAAVQSEPLLIGGRYDSSARTLDNGDAGAVALNASGHVLSELSASTVAIGKLAANSGVDIGDVDVTSIIPGTGATNLGKAEDTGHTSGDVGVMPLAVRKSTNPSALAGSDGDYAPFEVNQYGALWCELVAGGSPMAHQEDTAHTNGDVGFMSLAVRSDTLASLPGGTNQYTPLQVSAEGALYTVNGITGGADGVTTDDTNGTVLGGDVACKKIDIQAQTDNTGLIAVGFTGVDATVATGTGVLLNAGDVYSLEINNLNLIYIESSVNGEGVRFTYFT
tara:strand:- start:30 stop:1433 length:1404 start_codon:yes stop_codon:yes gene_type:complete